MTLYSERFAANRTITLNAHGDAAVSWSHDLMDGSA